MKNFLSRQREILAIVIYAGLVVGLVYFLVMPLLARIGDKSNQIQEDSLKQESLRKHLAELPNIEQQYKKLEGNSDAVDILLDKGNAVILIEKLEKLADDTGNKIAISVTPSVADQPKASAKDKAKVDESIVGKLPSQNYLQMKITLVGEYDSITNFIRLLENFEYYADITSIQLTQNDSADLNAKSVSNGSMSVGSPFGTAAPVVNTSQPIEVAKGNFLKASLDTVFYAK
ncbi:MAG: hypothetical protein PHW24_02860 [Candidatus Moranbacteria bacterium]|nr:hypothetical protein [Candidatus Moranbacteria bacterium]